MKASPLALAAVLASATHNPAVSAFTPSSFLVHRTTKTTPFVGTTCYVGTTTNARHARLTSLNLSGFLGMDDDDDDDLMDDDDDDDEDMDDLMSDEMPINPYTGKPFDFNDPNPPIPPRPGKFGFDNDDLAPPPIPDEQLVQTMTQEERKENLEMIRQLEKNDLPDLMSRRDYPGWVEANNELKSRQAKDPWYQLNERMEEAWQLNETDEIEKLQKLIDKVGGPPPGVPVSKRGYARATEIFDDGISKEREDMMMEMQLREERVARWKAMIAERKKNEERNRMEIEERRNNPEIEEREIQARREALMRRFEADIEKERQEKREEAKKILGKDIDKPLGPAESLDAALKQAKEDIKRMRRMREQGIGLGVTSDDVDEGYWERTRTGNVLEGSGDDSTVEDRPKGAAARAREAAAAESAGGRPRLPGDKDVTRGELTIPIEESSTTITGPLQVEVSSSYNAESSDPPMRKHCFQYTIRITNNSETDTVQLLSRRFEIQTVGSSMKDVVQGEGVTGRKPILKPGEVFEYTSTAPLSVRPIGTTIIAARMKGEYRYVTLKSGQETATPDQVEKGGDSSAELGTFHFVFPEEQRVKPVRPMDDDLDDDDDDDMDDDDDDKLSATTKKAEPTRSAAAPPTKSAAAAAETAKTTPKSTPSAVPASTLPGDPDMTSGNVQAPFSDSSDSLTDGVRVQVTSSYRPERSDNKLDKHCFAYNIRITNESSKPIQLVSRRFEIQTIGSQNKDVVQGPGVTGRQPILKPGESFEYTSTAPLSVRPMLEKTPVVARMQGEYNFVVLSEDGNSPTSSSPLQAALGKFHFVLPALDIA